MEKTAECSVLLIFVTHSLNSMLGIPQKPVSSSLLKLLILLARSQPIWKPRKEMFVGARPDLIKIVPRESQSGNYDFAI